ncbi:aminoglycoside phosphotransferase family protein [Kaistia dalseonensis]|uniref:Aminoglycoside phosphotransferase (APT) family kinase protein n=1 Tax=Kaistia dalseonensis TaxID=410840 RepID=A0ABU0H0I2_9HYPH|nr:aminoglycoside phosphotransferase family protein [Kaistia dalseonensis]MCX5493253.1 aminoglycoside phosphotransferase family protein [Kaistia dalseonensis]MDQ0435810.1 aminoglycoside phosphotransferase (APT) family kinase protein [Kaistia dalseonensis]
METERIAEALSPLALGRILAIKEMAGGQSPIYKIEFASGLAVILKGYPDGDPYLSSPDKDAFALAQLADFRGPISRQLLSDTSKQRLPFCFAVTNYLPGMPTGSFLKHPDIASMYRQIGSLLRSLHSVAMPAYGSFDGQGIVAPVSSNAAYVGGWIEHTFERFSAMGADAMLTKRLREAVEERFEAVVPHSKGAAFCHDDLHPNNVLAVENQDGTLTLSGLIDFGNARAADPVSDLAKCLFCSEHDAPGSSPHILDGYGPIDHPAPKAALEYYTLLHRMVMWWWLRHVGTIRTPDTPTTLIDDLWNACGVGVAEAR